MPVTEEVGKTSRELISVFQSAPLVFAVLLFNLLFMGMIIWVVKVGGERWEKAHESALKACQPKQERATWETIPLPSALLGN